MEVKAISHNAWWIPEVTWVAGFLSHKIGGGVIWVKADRPRTGNPLVIRLTRGEPRGGLWGRVSKHRRRAKFSEMRSSASDGKFFGMLCCPRCAWRIDKGQTWRESFVVRFEVLQKRKFGLSSVRFTQSRKTGISRRYYGLFLYGSMKIASQEGNIFKNRTRKNGLVITLSLSH